jgi:hypothetical protein
MEGMRSASVRSPGPEFLKTMGEGELRCYLETQVDAPNDVCDTYARVVGDLVVIDGQDNETKSESVDARTWLGVSSVLRKRSRLCVPPTDHRSILFSDVAARNRTV